MNSLTSRENKRRLKCTKDVTKQEEVAKQDVVDNWADDVIHIDSTKPLEGRDVTNKENIVKTERKY